MTTLAKKLGIKPGYTLCIIGAPQPYEDFFMGFPEDVKVLTSGSESVDFGIFSLLLLTLKSTQTQSPH